MVAAIPVIVASIIPLLLKSDKIEPAAAPDPADAEKIAAEQQKTIQQGRESFVRRQGSLGPIQLQAPTLKI